MSDLRDLAARLALEAGELAAQGRRDQPVVAGTKSTDTDMVTQFDHASEAHIVSRIREARPHDAIVGEEGSATVGTSGIGWLIDPIDGTTNFMFDLPGWAVSIAAVDHQGTVAGAVHVPSAGELFTAVRGEGAFLTTDRGTRRLRCSERTELATSLVATGFAYAPERRLRQAARVARMIGGIRDIRRFGAASVDLCHVAAGRVDAYFEEGLGPWDMAAGELIAREAGCRTGDFHGGPARPEEVLVAAPGVFRELAELIRVASTDAP